MMKRLTAILLVLIMVLSLTGSAFAAASYKRVLKKDMEGSDVSYMQERLTYYGYYTGQIDGKFGSGMRKAVLAFQKKNKLKYDGKIGQQTWDSLEADDGVKKSDQVEAFTILKRDMEGDAVTDLQLELRDTYYYGGKITGKFDQATEKAVKSFQASVGIKQDGKVGETTYDRLFNRSGRIFKDDAIPTRALGATSRGYDVYILQEKLISLNYLSGTANGYYGSTTTAAIKKFQAANGIEETGKLNSSTKRYLWPTQMDQNQQDSDDSKDTEYDKYNKPILKKGSHGSHVSTAQMRLKAAGYLLGKVDGVYGNDTFDAVKRFQKNFGLKQDGIIGASTWEKIMAVNIDNAEQDVVDSDKPSIGGPTGRLQMGDKGAAVTKLQQQLMQLNFLPSGSDDGVFGRKTRTAVRNFQKAYKIQVDGIVGTKTYVRLNEALGIAV